MSQDMSIKKKIMKDCLVVFLQGHIFEKDIQEIKKILDITWKENSRSPEDSEDKNDNKPYSKAVYPLVVDLSEVIYLDSAMLGALVEALYQHEEHGGQLYIGGINDEVRSILELLELHKVIPIFPDQKTALAHLRKEIPHVAHGKLITQTCDA